MWNRTQSWNISITWLNITSRRVKAKRGQSDQASKRWEKTKTQILVEETYCECVARINMKTLPVIYISHHIPPRNLNTKNSTCPQQKYLPFSGYPSFLWKSPISCLYFYKPEQNQTNSCGHAILEDCSVDHFNNAWLSEYKKVKDTHRDKRFSTSGIVTSSDFEQLFILFLNQVLIYYVKYFISFLSFLRKIFRWKCVNSPVSCNRKLTFCVNRLLKALEKLHSL